MDMKFQPKRVDDAELDVTSFMNLMVVLVPVLLITLSFTQVSVLDIHLPQLTGGPAVSESSQSKLVVKIHGDGFKVYYPEDVLVQEIPVTETEEPVAQYDFLQLSRVMQAVKEQLSDSRDVLLLSEPGIDYQSLISTMDTVRSFETVVAASVVEIELFPEISLGQIK